MKKIHFIYRFYSKIRASIVITFLVVTISIFAVCILSGVWRYQTYSYNVLKNEKLKNSIYVMTEDNYELSESQNVIQRLEEYDCVEAVLNVKTVNTFLYNRNCISMLLYSDDMLETFPMRTNGKYHIDDWKTDIADGIPVIVGTNLLGNAANEDCVSLKMQSSKGSKEIVVKPITELKTPYLPVTFSGSGSRITVGNIFSSIHCLIAYESPELLNYFEEYADITICSNFFVTFKPEYEQQEYQEMMAYISSIGNYTSYEEILANTKEDTVQNLKTHLPMPLYLMFSSLICVFSVTIITVYKKQKDIAVFYICGMSKVKIWIHFILSLSVVYWLAALINMYIVSWIGKMDNSYPIQIRIIMRTMLIGDGTIGHILLYVLLLLLIVSAVPLVMLRKETPMNILRRVE